MSIETRYRMRIVNNLFVEKINPSFRSMTKTNQASGLSVCIDMIVKALPESSKVAIDSMRHIELSVQRFRPKNLILSTIFLPENELRSLKKTFPSLNIYVMIHSNLPFLAVQGEAWQRIREIKESGCKLIVNDERLSRGVESIWLPNVYQGDFLSPRKIEDKETIKIICSGSLRPMKNHITQAVAAIKYGDKMGKTVEFHINSRSEGGAPVLINLKNIFRNSKHKLITAPWLSHSDFIRSLKGFDIGMQVSMSESFNVVAADYACAGLPMVVSSEIDWASKNTFADCHDVDSIVEKLLVCDKFTLESQENLRNYSERAVKLWSLI